MHYFNIQFLDKNGPTWFSLFIDFKIFKIVKNSKLKKGKDQYQLNEMYNFYYNENKSDPSIS